jgi:hypothetical protein
MAAGDGERGKLITGCELDAGMAEGDELVAGIDAEERRDADTVTPETFTCRDDIDTDSGAKEEDSLLENT